MILCAVFFYVRYAVSYRYLEEILARCGVKVDHTTLNSGVVKYAPKIAANAQRRKRQDLAAVRFLAWTVASISGEYFTTHRFSVVWSTAKPRSAKISSRSGYEPP